MPQIGGALYFWLGWPLSFCFCQRSTIPASSLGGVALWWKESPLRMQCHLFGCCLVPPWSREKERPGVAALEILQALGVRVWQQPTGSSPVPGCRTPVPSAVSTSRTDGSCQSSGFTCAFALFRLTLPLSINKGEACTYCIFSTWDIMLLSNQDL